MHYLRMAGKYVIMGVSYNRRAKDANGHAGNFYEQKGI